MIGKAPRGSISGHGKQGGLGREAAMGIAIAGLSHIASDGELLSRFLALTGTDPARIREEAARPAFLAGVLEFYLSHEPSLHEFAEASGHSPQSIVDAHFLLAGPVAEAP